MLQLRRGKRDNFGIIFRIPPINIYCDPSLEPSYRDSSNEGSQHMFSLKNKKNYLWILFSIPSLIWSSGRLVQIKSSKLIFFGEKM